MLDEKGKEMIIDELDKLGIDKSKVDDYMIWGVKKLMIGVMKIKWSLKENGIEGDEAAEKLAAIVDKVVDMDAEDLHEKMHKQCEGCDKKCDKSEDKPEE